MIKETTVREEEGEMQPGAASVAVKVHVTQHASRCQKPGRRGLGREQGQPAWKENQGKVGSPLVTGYKML